MKKYLLLFLLSSGLLKNALSQNVGINATGALPHPSAMLDVSAPDKGVLIPRTSTTSRLAITNPAKGLMLYDTTSSSFWFHNGSDWVELSSGPGSGGANYWSKKDMNIFNNNPGYVGINTNDDILNKLQIGDMGPAGFNGNDIAFGNNGQVTGIGQMPASMQIASTTDFVFLPQYGSSQGKVGINTSAPRFPLEVAGTLPITQAYAYYGITSIDFVPINDYNVTYSAEAQVSIYGAGNVMAKQFDAFSDARIKNIIGVSNAADDLRAINSIKVTDYTFKDTIKYGSRQFKKVIAQEVEKVYPQAVSKHRDFIPNVYHLTDGLTKTAGGYLFHFNKDHHLSDSAKRLQVLLSEKSSFQDFEILSIPSPDDVEIAAKYIAADKVFVYGEEVNDFRTVDYEGLATLNISATQEIGRLVSAQAATINNQQKEIDLLSARLSALEKTSRRTKSRLNKGRQLAFLHRPPAWGSFSPLINRLSALHSRW
ncbi:MAG TPA: tail fiber domain-containing protein [Puia sp.]|nr:tail fiber domain-containing protein [Puia sp.]